MITTNTQELRKYIEGLKRDINPIDRTDQLAEELMTISQELSTFNNTIIYDQKKIATFREKVKDTAIDAYIHIYELIRNYGYLPEFEKHLLERLKEISTIKAEDLAESYEF